MPRGRRPASPLRPNESKQDRNRRRNRERQRRLRQELDEETAAQRRHQRAAQEQSRLQNLDEEAAAQRRHQRAAQERSRIQNLDEEAAAERRHQRAAQEQSRVQNLDQDAAAQRRHQRATQEQSRIQNLDEEAAAVRRHQRAAQEQSRVQNLDEEAAAQRRHHRATQEQSRVQNLDEEAAAERRHQRAAQEQSRIQNLDEEAAAQQRQLRSIQEHNRRQNLDEEVAAQRRHQQAAQEEYRIQNLNEGAAEERQHQPTAEQQQEETGAAIEGRERRTIQEQEQIRHFDVGANEEYAAYLQVISENHQYLEDHPYVQQQQQAFYDDVNGYEMRHCITCKERWFTMKDLDVPQNEYKCTRCLHDTILPPKFSDYNDMIPLTLASGSVPSLVDAIDATPLECMLVALACPVMRVVRLRSGGNAYDNHSINFMQNLQSFIASAHLPRLPRDTPYFIVVRRGVNSQVAESRVRRNIVRILLTYLIENNPLYSNITINEEVLNSLPENDYAEGVNIIDDSSQTNSDTNSMAVNDSIGNMETSVSVPGQVQREDDAISRRLEEMGARQLSQVQWPTLGSQPINEFETQHLSAMCFPELFLNGCGDPTNSARLRDVSEKDAASHLIKFCVKYGDNYIYPFARHERFGAWMQSRIERHRTLSQANFCMRQSVELRQTTVEELIAMARNPRGREFVNQIYKYTANITGSDPYWYQRRREMIAQANQEGLSGTLFWTFSAADNHWCKLMDLLGIERNAPLHERRRAIINNPHIVDSFFCRRVEKACKYLLRKVLVADWIWYRYEFQLRGATHCHGMIKVKIPINILELVSVAYAGRKGTEKLDYASYYETMTIEEKNDFANAAQKDESVRKEYHSCINAYMELHQNMEMRNQVLKCIEDGTEAEKKVLDFHTWLVTANNGNLAPITDQMKADESHLESLYKKVHLVRLKITTSTVLNKDSNNEDHNRLVEQESEIQEQINEITNRFEVMFSQAESDFAQEGYIEDPHPCSFDWNTVRNDEEHYKSLVRVQRHKCVGTYCLRRKKDIDGREYGRQYCRFDFPKRLQAHSKLIFEEFETGGVRASFVSARNDPRMNQHCSMLLKSWLANCDLQIVLDEEQAIRYLVKYASKPEKGNQDVSDILRSVVPTSNNADQNNTEEGTSGSVSVAGPTLIRKLAIKSLGQRNRSKQEIMHLLLQERMYHSDFSYVNINLDKYNVRTINRKRSATGNDPAFYPNIFDHYGSRTTDMDISFLEYCKKYNIKGGELVQRRKRTVVITFPNRSNDPVSRYYYKYCKFFLIKHRPWRGSVENAWDGPIPNSEENDDQEEMTENDDVKRWFINKYEEFCSQPEVNVASLEMFNSDIDRLRRIREEYQVEYEEEADILEQYIGGEQDRWMQFAQIAPDVNDAVQIDTLAPPMDPNIDWLQLQKTPNQIVPIATTHLKDQKENNADGQREIQSLPFQSLNIEQRFAVNIVRHLLENSIDQQLLMFVIGGPGTGKSTVIGSISRVVNDVAPDSTLRLGTTGTAAFVICGSTCHSKLYLPINRPYHALSGESLRKLQATFQGIKVIIIDEVSMMGKKMLHYIDQRLRQASGRLDCPFGDFWVIFVGDFRQLPPVGDKAIYIDEGSNDTPYALFESIENVVFLQKSERQNNLDDQRDAFARILQHCEEGKLDQQDWSVLRSRFIQTAIDTSNPLWDDASRLFYDNKSTFEYNMSKLIKLNKPIAKLEAAHNCRPASKRDSTEADGLHSCLYLCEDAKVMLTSNLWSEVGLHNGAIGEVVDFVYTSSDGPRTGDLPEAVVVKFPQLSAQLQPFLETVPGSVAIPASVAEWPNPTRNGGIFTRKQFPLALSWAITIHKSQGKTLPRAVVDLGRGEKCAGMTLVALSRVRSLNDLLLKPFSMERLNKVNNSTQLALVQSAISRLEQKYERTKNHFAELL